MHNSVQMYLFFTNFLTKAAHLKTVDESRKYIIVHMPVGEIVFNLIMHKAIIKTIATTNHLWWNTASLNTYITTRKSNSDSFNQYMKVNMDGLKANGEITYYLMINLLYSYKSKHVSSSWLEHIFGTGAYSFQICKVKEILSWRGTCGSVACVCQ